ncbi:MAG: FkbM family methyltransferase [Betaproteobacteria bacterium]|nr:FkbM family methyltransferase [Betaproteobacteria bacterium]
MNYEPMDLDVAGTRYQLLIPPESTNATHFREVFQRNGHYEAVMTAILGRLFECLDRPAFADMGAFIGYYTGYGAKVLEGRGEVFAFESNPAYVDVLKAMVKLNGYTNARVFAAALSDREETLIAQGTTLHRGNAERDFDFRLQPEHLSTRPPGVPGYDGAPVAVATTTFDALCAEQGLAPNIAKMDVHGTEGKILGGMARTLRGPLRFLLLELHQNVYLRQYSPGHTRLGILDLIEDAGFRLYYVAGHRYTWSGGLKVFLETGRFAYQALTRDTREMLLYDRHGDIFVLAAKEPIEPLLGESVHDPALV